MKPRRGNWSAAELGRLRELYPRCPAHRLAARLGRTTACVRRRAALLFDRPKKRGPWTADEDRGLRAAYGLHDLAELALFLARSEREVAERVDRLRRRYRRGPWTRGEQTLLKRVYGERSDDDLEVCLSRSRAQIAAMAAALCLRKDKRFVAVRSRGPRLGGQRMPRWSPQEVKRLTALYPVHGNLEIARQLGRSVTGVANKANQLELRKTRALRQATGRDNVRARYP